MKDKTPVRDIREPKQRYHRVRHAADAAQHMSRAKQRESVTPAMLHNVWRESSRQRKSARHPGNAAVLRAGGSSGRVPGYQLTWRKLEVSYLQSNLCDITSVSSRKWKFSGLTICISELQFHTLVRTSNINLSVKFQN